MASCPHLHKLQKLDDHLGGRADEDLPARKIEVRHKLSLGHAPSHPRQMTSMSDQGVNIRVVKR